jgi:hypothetical protein
MSEKVISSQRTFSRRWLLVTLIFAIPLVGLVVGIMVVRRSVPLSPTERRLVGSWTTPDRPGCIQLMTLTPDRRLTGQLISEKSGAIISHVYSPGEATWYLEDETLSFERRGPQFRVSMFDVLLGRQLNWYRLLSVSDDQFVLEFVINNGTHRTTFKRAASSPTTSSKSQGVKQ